MAPRIPNATYRLQLNKNFDLRRAKRMVKYLSDLGISDCYSSPLLKARAGSLHCYDVVDHNTLNPELGTEKEFDAFVSELKRRGMGLLLDIVPNHMGAGDENRIWMSVLEFGKASPYASYFDIDWSKRGNPKDKLFLPILGEPLDETVAAGRLCVSFDPKTAKLFLELYDNQKFPLSPRSYARVLNLALGNLPGRNLNASFIASLKSLRSSLEQLEESSSRETYYRLALRRGDE